MQPLNDAQPELQLLAPLTLCLICKKSSLWCTTALSCPSLHAAAAVQEARYGKVLSAYMIPETDYGFVVLDSAQAVELALQQTPPIVLGGSMLAVKNATGRTSVRFLLDGRTLRMHRWVSRPGSRQCALQAGHQQSPVMHEGPQHWQATMPPVMRVCICDLDHEASPAVSTAHHTGGTMLAVSLATILGLGAL